MKVSIDIVEFISTANSTVICITKPVVLFYDTITTQYNILGLKDNRVIF